MFMLLLINCTMDNMCDMNTLDLFLTYYTYFIKIFIIWVLFLMFLSNDKNKEYDQDEDFEYEAFINESLINNDVFVDVSYSERNMLKKDILNFIYYCLAVTIFCFTYMKLVFV